MTTITTTEELSAIEDGQAITVDGLTMTRVADGFRTAGGPVLPLTEFHGAVAARLVSIGLAPRVGQIMGYIPGMDGSRPHFDYVVEVDVDANRVRCIRFSGNLLSLGGTITHTANPWPVNRDWREMTQGEDDMPRDRYSHIVTSGDRYWAAQRESLGNAEEMNRLREQVAASELVARDARNEGRAEVRRDYDHFRQRVQDYLHERIADDMTLYSDGMLDMLDALDLERPVPPLMEFTITRTWTVRARPTSRQPEDCDESFIADSISETDSTEVYLDDDWQDVETTSYDTSVHGVNEV